MGNLHLYPANIVLGNNHKVINRRHENILNTRLPDEIKWNYFGIKN
jgi:hypothetical protein